MKTLILFAAATLCLCQGCATMDAEKTSTTRVVDTTLSFAEKIQTIERDISSMEEAKDLDYSTTYVELFENPEPDLTAALAFIKDRNNTLQQKQIAAYAMSNLPLDKYLQFANTAYRAYRTRNAAEELIAQIVLYQYPSPSNKIVMNYQNPGVIQLLSQLKGDSRLSPEFKKEVDDVLSGSKLKDHLAKK